MTDLSSLSNDQLLALYAQTQKVGGGAPAQSAVPLAAPGSANDPSAGGGTLQIGSFDTGWPTPQWEDRILSGIGRGMTHTARSVGNLLGLVPDSAMANESAIDKPLLSTRTGRAGNILGESALTSRRRSMRQRRTQPMPAAPAAHCGTWRRLAPRCSRP
jgi:hypothetical protein